MCSLQACFMSLHDQRQVPLEAFNGSSCQLSGREEDHVNREDEKSKAGGRQRSTIHLLIAILSHYCVCNATNPSAGQSGTAIAPTRAC
jgi:hypothetical protein